MCRGEAADGIGVVARDVCHAGEGVEGGFDLALVRHVLFIAREVEAHADTEQHEDACDDRRALRPRAEDAEALFDEHLSGKVAHKPRRRHAEDRAGQGIVAARAVLAEEEIVEELPEGNGGAERHAVFKDGRRPREGDRRAGHLALARAVEEQRDEGDDKPRERVDGKDHERAVLERVGGHIVRVALAGLDRGDVHPEVHIEGRGEEVERNVGVPTVAVEEVARKVAQQIFHSRNENIADEIEDGRGEDLPRHHHAQHGEGVEKDGFEHGAAHGRASDAPETEVQRGRDRRAEQERDENGGKLAEQSREVGGQKDGLTPHGERVEAVRRAALRQVREGKHRKEKAEDEGNEDAAAHAGIEQQTGRIRCAVAALIGGKL